MYLRYVTPFEAMVVGVAKAETTIVVVVVVGSMIVFVATSVVVLRLRIVRDVDVCALRGNSRCGGRSHHVRRGDGNSTRYQSRCQRCRG